MYGVIIPMENYEKRINANLIKGWLIIVVVLLIAYFIEFLKGQRTWQYMIVFSFFVAGPALFCYYFYRKDNEERRLRYLILGGYLVMYAFVLLTGSTTMVFTYILPMLSLIVLYHQPSLVLGMGVITLVANLIYDFNLLRSGKVTLENSKDIEIQLALLVLCFGFLYVSARLYDDIVKKNREYFEALDNKQKQLQRVTMQTITTVANTNDAKDGYTKGHSQRVAEYSALIARLLGYDDTYVQNVKYVALLHDIGKIGVPDSILNKPGRLTDEEFTIMRQHTDIGVNILRDNGIITDLLEGVHFHHERYDGKGYPNGLKGEEIPLVARIIGLTDAYDAMTSNRVYRKRLSDEDVIAEIEKCSGTQFDPKIAQVFIQALKSGKIQQLSPDDYVSMDGLESQSALLLQNILELQNTQNVLKEEKDYLTGAYNKRHGEQKIADYLSKGEGCLMLFDIVNLREVNNKYSFVGGDHLIKSIAEVLENYKKEKLVVCRYDGDEFLCFAANVTDEKRAEDLMQSVLEAVKRHITDKMEYGQVHICVGGVTSATVGRDYHKMLIAADKALYYMKQMKKDGCYLYRTSDKKVSGEGQLSREELQLLVNSIQEDGSYEGIYNVDYPEFVKIYELIKKMTVRNKQDVQMILLTLKPLDGKKISVAERDEAMYHLENAINSALRNIDIMMRLSSTQCLVFLMNLSEENIELVTNRIMNSFYKSCDKRNTILTYDVADLKLNQKET